VDTGFKFGQLGLELVSKLNAKAIKSDIFGAAACFTLHRKSHIRETLPLIQQTYRVGLEFGSLEFVGYGAQLFCLSSFLCGETLTNLEQETRAYCNSLQKLNQLTTANYCRIYWQSTLNLLGSDNPTNLSGIAVKESELLPLLIEANDLFGLFVFYLNKVILCYLLGDFEKAINNSIEARKYAIASTGMIVKPVFYFYESLTILATCNLQSNENKYLVQILEENQS